MLAPAVLPGCTKSTPGTSGLTDGGASGHDAATAMDAGGCTYAGKHYAVGASFRDTDGCNGCTCQANGLAACTLIYCIPKDGGPRDGAALDGGSAPDASSCNPTPVGRLCVRGAIGSGGGEPVAVGDKLKLQVTPKGCFSSSCTHADVAECSIASSASSYAVDASFCLANTGGAMTACTADCGGGGFATCESLSSLSAGNKTITLGGLSVSFTVPSTLPLGGACNGSPF